MLSIIQEYSNHLEEIFKNSFDYIYLHDKKGNILDVNDVVVKNLGYSKQEILKMKVTDFLLEEALSDVIDEIKQTIETGLVNKPKTYKVRKKDGTFIYVEASAIPLKTDGEFYAILGIGHDVTVYKKVEQKLRESKKNFRHLFDQSPNSILIFDSNGTLIESNRKLVQKLGEFIGIDFYGKNFVEIISYFKNSKQLLQIFMERFKALREVKDLEPLEFPIITKDDKKLWLYWQSSKVQIDDETFIQVIINDITELKNAEEKLRSSEEKFRNIAEQSFMGIVIIQAGEFKYMNKTMSRISGYPVEEMLNWSKKEMLKLTYPEDLDVVLKRLQSNIEGNMAAF
ncbi:MAG: PAS domain S-box protein, partial [Candidatus Hodarchaeota archaeon]